MMYNSDMISRGYLAQNSNQSMNLREDDSFELLKATISGFADEKGFDYYPSPGNWGDALINEGSEQFFQVNKIKYQRYHRSYATRIFDTSSRPRGNTAIVGGGGGWCKNWSSTSSFVKILSELYSHVIILPTTYDTDVEDLNLRNVTYFSRSSGTRNRNVHFCHDMAFYILLDEVYKGNITYPLISLRRDKERNQLSINPDRNWDLSLLGDSFTSPKGLFEIVARFKTIYTDRLHVAISGSLLGSQVFLLEGNYNKNETVFSASIENKFPNTQMLKWEDFNQMKIIGLEPIGKSGY